MASDPDFGPAANRDITALHNGLAKMKSSTEMATEIDRRWMRVAIAAARQAEGRTGSNPPVGCAIISTAGNLIAVGHTARQGRPHAETAALQMAGDASRGATAYVTLEPCAHTGQTGPCADAIIAAGIARVVIAVRDPDPRVNGQGIDRLRASGIVVQTGVEALAAHRVMAGFLMRMTAGRPLITLKTATSLDGMIALHDGAKRWITGAAMRRYIHLQRSRADGLLSAIGTVLADDPEFTCRIAGLEADSPHRFILDSNLRLPANAKLLESVPAIGLTVFCREDAMPDRIKALRQSGVEVCPTASDKGGHLALEPVMRAIAGAGCGNLMVESGGKLAASLLQTELPDRIFWTQSTHLIGSDGIPVIGSMQIDDLPPKPAFNLVSQGSFGPDRFIMLERAAHIV